ncbi:MAG: elongation factor Ts [Planctomycetota bacterium]|nr:elongation factor Ts [Planctomycetota bacterium]MDA1138806.1 elongation factor Ts [Planctomycetota bacterium]
MAVSAAQIKELRESTGGGVMECKKALEEAGGDLAKAKEILKLMNAKTVEKKAGRVAGMGKIVSYIHPPGRIGVLVEMRCETDFVANNPEFIALSKDICMHIAAMSPAAVNRESIPEETVNLQKELFREEVKDKPAAIQEKILEGKLNAFFKEMTLLDQPFAKDTKVTVGEHIKSKIGLLQENITVARMVRWETNT